MQTMPASPASLRPDPGALTDKIHVVRTQKGGRVSSTLHKVRTADGLEISLSRFAAPAQEVVLLIHGLTTSSDMFLMPEHYNLGAFLLDQGFEVWAADFRMSNHFAYNIKGRFTFEDVAANDWPALIGFIRSMIGPERRLHVICHCLGSVTFHHALYGKTIGGISSVVSNSISFNTRVHPWAVVKLLAAPFMVEKVLRLPYIDPRWNDAKHPQNSRLGKLIAKVVDLVHLECNDQACNLVSFTWGSGFPALFEHDNMSPETHARLADLFGPIAMPYFRNVRSAVLHNNTFGRYSTKPEHKSFPDRYIDNVGEVKVPTLFIAGAHNHIFPGANRLSHELIKKKGVPGYDYVEFPTYGHQDIFMGQKVDQETFPTILEFLRRVQPAPAVGAR